MDAYNSFYYKGAEGSGREGSPVSKYSQLSSQIKLLNVKVHNWNWNWKRYCFSKFSSREILLDACWYNRCRCEWKFFFFDDAYQCHVSILEQSGLYFKHLSVIFTSYSTPFSFPSGFVLKFLSSFHGEHFKCSFYGSNVCEPSFILEKLYV